MGCGTLIDQFKDDVLTVSFTRRCSENHVLQPLKHFREKGDCVYGRLEDYAGSYMFNYGFLPHDFGFNTFVASKKGLRSGYRREPPLSQFELSDDDDSDYNSDYEESSSEPDEEYIVQDARLALAELQGPPKTTVKKRKHNTHPDDVASIFGEALTVCR